MARPYKEPHHSGQAERCTLPCGWNNAGLRLSIIVMPHCFVAISQLKVSMKRLEDYMTGPDSQQLGWYSRHRGGVSLISANERRRLLQETANLW